MQMKHELPEEILDIISNKLKFRCHVCYKPYKINDIYFFAKEIPLNNSKVNFYCSEYCYSNI